MTKNNRNPKGQKLNPLDLKKAIYKILKLSPTESFTVTKVLKLLKVTNNKPEALQALIALTEENKIKERAHEVFQYKVLSITKRVLVGEVDMTKTGAAYIKIDGRKDDVYIPSKYINTAMDGDIVEIELSDRRKGNGQIKRVIKRTQDHFMGRFFQYERFGVVVPLKSKTNFDITVYPENYHGAQQKDIVTVKVLSWPEGKNKHIKGSITEVLGQEDSSDMQMKSILINNGFELQFSKAAMAEVDKIPTSISDQEIERRVDMRDRLTFTIDPINAKDFDDALSIKRLEDGNLEIGVHIADVTHYLKPGSPLDTDAYQRSTSVYLVDRVLPMLPEKLSNELCSLRPHETSLTFSAVFIFDQEFNILKKWFDKTVIYSDRRFSYEEAQEILDGKPDELFEDLKLLNSIAKKLAKERYKNGAISFETDEVQFILDSNGVPIEMYVKERKDAHMLVEDFMLLANKSVAEYIQSKSKDGEIPFVYRVHDLPNQEKLEDFSKFAKELGYTMDLSNPKAIARSFNKLSELSKENETLKFLEPLAIRTMAKAEYSPENIGHYGLAFDNYSHFTSPIRRYSDVLAHRILYKNLHGNVFREDKHQLTVQCKHISSQERKAMEAERESIKYKQVEFISQFIGQEFEGIVAGIIERGLFIELVENKCEGFIRFDRFDESFDMEENRLKVKGRRTGRVIKMGDHIKVKVMDTDMDKRQIELEEVK